MVLTRSQLAERKWFLTRLKEKRAQVMDDGQHSPNWNWGCYERLFSELDEMEGGVSRSLGRLHIACLEGVEFELDRMIPELQSFVRIFNEMDEESRTYCYEFGVRQLWAHVLTRLVHDFMPQNFCMSTDWLMEETAYDKIALAYGILHLSDALEYGIDVNYNIFEHYGLPQFHWITDGDLIVIA